MGEHGGDERRIPSIGALRSRLAADGARLGTGWPVIDDVTGGLPIARPAVVRGPADLRLQVLARAAAWAAGEGYPTMLASRTHTTDELWLAVAAGGLGLPPAALLSSQAHDAWIDARLRVLDLRVHGGADAPERAVAAVAARTPALLVIDDFATWDQAWIDALEGRFGRLELHEWPRRTGCTLVLGVTGMDDFSDWLDRGVLTVRLVPAEDHGRVTVTACTATTRRQRTVLLRDGFLEPPGPGARYLRRPGVDNVWEDRTDAEISTFASILGADVSSLVWERGDEAGPVEC